MSAGDLMLLPVTDLAALVRGGPVEALEGAWTPLRIVVMEFPDRDAARAWYSSDDYQAIAPLRQGASTTDIILVDGV